MATPYKCPVCNGEGKKKYRSEKMDATGYSECKSCHGTGIVWDTCQPIMPTYPVYPTYPGWPIWDVPYKVTCNG